MEFFSAAGTGADPADRRRYPRRKVPGIVGTLRSPDDVRVLDLSVTGLSAELADEVRPGQHCYLELRYGGSRATVETVVKWSKLPRIQRDASRPPLAFVAGMAFVDIARDSTDGLWGCILPESEA
jgi:hypothetical protein